MENNILSEYLQYLDEQGRVTRYFRRQAKPFKNAKVLGRYSKTAVRKGVKGGLIFSLLITPALWSAWRLATAASNQAYRKCGIFASGPGRKLCVIREKIKAARTKIGILNQAKSQCSSKTAKPAECRNTIDSQINQLKLNIDSLQNQYENLTGLQLKESENVQELLLGAVLAILGTIVVDKVLFVAWRSLKATYDADLRKCGIYKNNEEFKVCKYTAKLANLLKKQALLRRVGSECNKQKDPDKCRRKVSYELRKLFAELQKAKDDLLVSRKELADKRAAERV